MAVVSAPLDDLRGQWDDCKAQENKKDTLVQTLFQTIETLQRELKKVRIELGDQTELASKRREDKEAADMIIHALQTEKNRCPFVLLLVDGDCMPFEDHLVKSGHEGGKDAARLLKQRAEEVLSRVPGLDTANLNIMVRVYANVTGLAKVYKDSDILADERSTYEFIRGFNQVQALFDYVDAGTGKECADEKMRALFKANVEDVHCRHILFAASADNGYARLLQPYVGNDEVSRRLTLVEGPPFARELDEIKDSFRVVTLDGVFRTEKLVNPKRRVSFSQHTPTSAPATPVTDYAAVAALPSPVPFPAAEGTTAAAATHAPSSKIGVARNRAGQRVDRPLKYRPKDFNEVKALKLCNSHHILGRCSYIGAFGNCNHKHSDPLPEGKLAALRAVARLARCPRGLKCDDGDCLAGHQCPWQDCDGKDCRFPKEMHGVDKTVVVSPV